MNPDEAASMMTNPDGSLDASGLDDIPTGSGSDGHPSDATPGVDTGKTLLDRLLNTQPNTPLESVESPWQPDVGGPARIYRGIQKIGDIEGMPAIADLVIGIVETMQQQSNSGDSVDSVDSESDVDWETAEDIEVIDE